MASHFTDLVRISTKWEDELVAYFDGGHTNAATEAFNGVIKRTYQASGGIAFNELRERILTQYMERAGPRPVRQDVGHDTQPSGATRQWRISRDGALRRRLFKRANYQCSRCGGRFLPDEVTPVEGLGAELADLPLFADAVKAASAARSPAARLFAMHLKPVSESGITHLDDLEVVCGQCVARTHSPSARHQAA